MSRTPTAKQQAVLDALRDGKTVWQAMQAAGVSESYDNRAAFLMRLVDAGLVQVVVPTSPAERA